VIPAGSGDVPGCVLLVIAIVDLYFYAIPGFDASEKYRRGLAAIRQDAAFVVACARVAIETTVHMLAVV
jgi:hypothetical protein